MGPGRKKNRGGKYGRLDAKRKDERRRKRQLDSSGPNVNLSLPNAEDAAEEMEADGEEDAGSEASYYSSSEEFGDEERAPEVRSCMEEELTSDEEDVEDSPMDLLNNGVVFRGPEDITSKDFTSHLAKWDKQDDGLISKMLCCAFCGQCELGGERPTALLQSLHHLGPTEQHSRCPPTVSLIPISRTTC